MLKLLEMYKGKKIEEIEEQDKLVELLKKVKEFEGM